MHEESLSGAEIVLLIEALDALIPFHEDTRSAASSEQRERWQDYDALRCRLKRIVRISFYDNARGWLDAELRRERDALVDVLHARLADLLRVPGATPRSVREGWMQTARDLREVRQSNPRPDPSV